MRSTRPKKNYLIRWPIHHHLCQAPILGVPHSGPSRCCDDAMYRYFSLHHDPPERRWNMKILWGYGLRLVGRLRKSEASMALGYLDGIWDVLSDIHFTGNVEPS